MTTSPSNSTDQSIIEAVQAAIAARDSAVAAAADAILSANNATTLADQVLINLTTGIKNLSEGVLKGDTGATGATGATGPKGDTGVQGAKGDTGAQGVQGLVGPTGAKGDTGNTGHAGPTGPQGATGPKGDTGAQGATGPAGTGADAALTDNTAPTGSRKFRWTNASGKVALQRLDDAGTTVLDVPATFNEGVLEIAKPPKITTAHIDRNGWVNPESAGADTSGVGDSSTAFQVSLDLLANRGIGGGFIVPAGTCRITQPLTYQSSMGIKMSGFGTSSRIRQNTADNVKMFDFRPPPGVFLRGMVLEDFYIECQSTNARTFEFVSNRALSVRNVSGEPLSENYWWSDTWRFIACLESRMDGGVWKNALGSEGTDFSKVRGRLYNFFNTVLNFAIHKPLAVGFDTCAYGDVATSPGIEGLSFYDCNFVAVNRGYDIRNQGEMYGGVNSQYGAPGSLRIHGGHVHSFSECIRVRQGSCNIIQGVLLFRDLTHNQPGAHIFAGRQHNLQIAQVQNRVVGNGAGKTQGTPPMIITGGDYVSITDVSSFVGATSGNTSINAGSATITNCISNGPNLTGNGFDVFTPNSILTAVRLV